MSNHQVSRRRRLGALAVTAAFTLAACGGDDSADEPGDSSVTPQSTAGERAPATSDASPATTATTSHPSTSAPSGSEPEATAPPAGEPTGDPVIVYHTDTGTQGDIDDVLAAIESGVNARGGIAGRPLELKLCRDNQDVNEASRCAQTAVDDGAIAIVGNSTTCGSQLADILASAQLASVSDQYFCPDLFASENVFPFNAGFLSASAATALGVEFFDQPNVLVATIDAPATHAYVELLGGVVAPAGGTVTKTVFIPLTVTDMAPYAAQLANEEGLLAEGNTLDIAARLYKELQQQGFEQPVIVSPTTFDAGVIEANFENPTNFYLGSGFDLDSEGFAMFNADLTEFAPEYTRRNGVMQAVWLGVNVLADVAPELPELSSAAVLEYFQTATDIDTFGMSTKPLNFTVKNDAMGGTIPQVSNDLVALYRYEDGELIRESDWVDVLE